MEVFSTWEARTLLIGDNERAEADYTNIFQGYLPHVHLGLMLRDYWSFPLNALHISPPPTFIFVGVGLHICCIRMKKIL